MRFPSEFNTKQVLQAEDQLLVSDSANDNAPAKAGLSRLWAYIQSELAAAEGVTLQSVDVDGDAKVGGSLLAAGATVSGDMSVSGSVKLPVNGEMENIGDLLGTMTPFVITEDNIMDYIVSTGDDETTFADLTDAQKLNIALRLCGSYWFQSLKQKYWKFPAGEMRVIRCEFQHLEEELRFKTYLYLRKNITHHDDVTHISTVRNYEVLLSYDGFWLREVGYSSPDDFEWHPFVTGDLGKLVTPILTEALKPYAAKTEKVSFLINPRTITIDPDKLYIFKKINTLASLHGLNGALTISVTLGPVFPADDYVHEYMLRITIGTLYSPFTLNIIPSSGTIKWANDDAPVWQANTTYEISIIDNLATYIKF